MMAMRFAPSPLVQAKSIWVCSTLLKAMFEVWIVGATTVPVPVTSDQVSPIRIPSSFSVGAKDVLPCRRAIVPQSVRSELTSAAVKVGEGSEDPNTGSMNNDTTSLPVPSTKVYFNTSR